MAAGFAAALVLSAFLLLNAESGFMPPADFAALLGGLTGTGAPGGWALHFLIGILWGGLFAWLDPDLPGDSLRQRGVIFALVPWMAMMVVLMPLAGYGVFGLEYGVLLPLAALALHLIFGAVMGSTYDWLLRQAVPLRYRQPRRSTASIPARTREISPPAAEIASPVVVPNAPALAPAGAAPLPKLKSAKTTPRRPTSAPAAISDLKSRTTPASKTQPLAAQTPAAESTVLTRIAPRPKA
jgi:hypothetical protein